MSGPVISATYTVCDGLVVRWRRTAESDTVVSASRNAVMIHGDVMVTGELKQWIADAERARELIRSGREDEAKAMATHRYNGMFSLDLVPVEPPSPSQPEERGEP